jgi:hypothetical protein
MSGGDPAEVEHIPAGAEVDLRIPRRPGLSAVQRSVESELGALVQRTSVVDPLYDALRATSGGKILGMDHVRSLSPSYVERPVLFTPATRNPAAKYVKHRLHRALSARRGGALLMTSGGSASGKSTALSGLLAAHAEEAHVILDCTLSKEETARQTIEQAMASGWRVVIAHVHRPYALSVGGMLARAEERGRYVGLGPGRSMSRLHADARATFLRLLEAYAGKANGKGNGDAAVRFVVVDNSGVAPIYAEVADVQPGGRLSLPETPELLAIEARAAQAFVAAGGSERMVSLCLRGATGMGE